MDRSSPPEDAAEPFIPVGTLAELTAQRMKVVRGANGPLLVVSDGGRVFALDNRCPHLGFPLHRGSVEDGILTCHWHHARFDLASGCTFDLWADDVATAAVEVRPDGSVWVAPRPRHADGAAHWRNRLREGLEQNLGLVLAKAVLGLEAEAGGRPTLIGEAVRFGARQRDGWGVGLTTLTALANLLPDLPEPVAYLALYHGLGRVAADCEGAVPRRDRAPLAGAAPRPLAQLERWMRHWIRVRHRDGAERTLLTAVAGGAGPAALASLLLVAGGDRAFADGGHALDFANKACECLDLVGWKEAVAVLPTLVEQLADARGGEEANAWRHPVDLVALCEAAFTRLPERLAAGRSRHGRWDGHAPLAQALLGDDPAAIVAALETAVADGAAAADLGRSLAYAAALRLARFGTANEHADWEAAHHAFTYANAVHQLLLRAAPAGPERPELLRPVFHGAARLYLLRFLNVPPARLPGETGEPLDDLPLAAEALLQDFLAALDRQGSVDAAGRLVARYLLAGHPGAPLIATLAESVLREDADFHAYQSLEAGVRQYRAWGGGAEGRHVLVGVARYLAAHAPTERARRQTALVALRLGRGEVLHAADGDA
jgi:nitrite reductase/ring-hydroxylating ferredoxin subunit